MAFIKVVCNRCNGTQWLEPLGPYSDGSYITSRPCGCHEGYAWIEESRLEAYEQVRERLKERSHL